MSDINNQGFELDWDSEIEKDGQEYITLPEGVYPFTVMNFERARYNPSAKAKLPPCNMAVMSLQFKGAEGVATIKDKLYLHSSVEWRLCAFSAPIPMTRARNARSMRCLSIWSRTKATFRPRRQLHHPLLWLPLLRKHLIRQVSSDGSEAVSA